MKAKLEALKQASYKLAEEMYKAQQGAPEGAAGDAGAAGGEADHGADKAHEGPRSGSVEDVDYEVVDDDDKN
jgi:molecular chaperone DnaK